MADVINLTGVSVVRSGRTIVSDLDWAVSEGQQWVILGPNGAGKTTVLQIAATLLHPSAGTAEVLDERIGAVDVFELRPRIGLASSALGARIPDSERVRDVILTSAWAVLGRWQEAYEAADTRRAEALLDQWGLAAVADASFATLSEGERKRALIARALMADPELLLLDEPAAGMDLAGREDLLVRLDDLAVRDYAPTQVMVTHHVEEIPVTASHVLLMRGGRAVAQGPLQETLTSEAVSATFGIDIDLSRSSSRWSAQVRR